MSVYSCRRIHLRGRRPPYTRVYTYVFVNAVYSLSGPSSRLYTSRNIFDDTFGTSTHTTTYNNKYVFVRCNTVYRCIHRKFDFAIVSQHNVCSVYDAGNSSLHVNIRYINNTRTLVVVAAVVFVVSANLCDGIFKFLCVHTRERERAGTLGKLFKRPAYGCWYTDVYVARVVRQRIIGKLSNPIAGFRDDRENRNLRKLIICP